MKDLLLSVMQVSAIMCMIVYSFGAVLMFIVFLDSDIKLKHFIAYLSVIPLVFIISLVGYLVL